MRTDLILRANETARAFLESFDTRASAALCLGDQGELAISVSAAKDWVKLTRTYMEATEQLIAANDSLAADNAALGETIAIAAETIRGIRALGLRDLFRFWRKMRAAARP